MDNIHPQAALLLGYVDKQLSPEEITEVETLLDNDPKALVFVETLGASQLPFAESFEFLLEDQDSAVENTILENASSNRINSEPKRNSLQWSASIAASLMLGLVIGYGVFSSTTDSTQGNNWVTEVANYQLLYVRDTVTTAPTLSDSQHIALQTKLSKALNSDLHIPNLQQQKLTFKRGQILDIEGEPLIQLVYLPDDGLPIALCILRNGAVDSLPKSGESRGQTFIEWSKNGLSYVIIGKTDKKNLEAAAMTAIAQI
ncbi:MAG: hypothetical protein V7749_16420 [Cocleimonas sp.]